MINSKVPKFEPERNFEDKFVLDPQANTYHISFQIKGFKENRINLIIFFILRK